MMSNQTLVYLTKLININKKDRIIPAESCRKLFDMQIKLVEKCDAFNCLKIITNSYKELLSEYPIKKCHYLNESNEFLVIDF